MSHFVEYSRSPGTNWKRTGIELKLSEFIENLAVEEFNYPEMVLFLEKLMTSVKQQTYSTYLIITMHIFSSNHSSKISFFEK